MTGLDFKTFRDILEGRDMEKRSSAVHVMKEGGSDLGEKRFV
jgi:hypothetical protein